VNKIKERCGDAVDFLFEIDEVEDKKEGRKLG